MSTEVSHLISNQSVIAEEIAELVVTAIGANGRQYLCWKTPTGEYRQYRYCLPERLDKWLFPDNGTTRDFETLQVVLSSDDRFWASDKNGQIQSGEAISASSKDGSKRRSELSSQRPWRTSRDIILGTERRRAATVSPSEGDRKHSQRGGLDGSHSRSSSLGAIPLAAALRRPKRFSGQQFASFQDHDVLKEGTAVSSRSSLLASETLRQGPRCSSCCNKSRATSTVSWGSDTTEVERPLYTDSSAQTDLASPPAHRSTVMAKAMTISSVADHEAGHSINTGEHHSAMPGSTSLAESPCDEEALQNTQGYFESFGVEGFECLPNPIAMGRMQDYFRAGNYALGDALQ